MYLGARAMPGVEEVGRWSYRRVVRGAVGPAVICVDFAAVESKGIVILSASSPADLRASVGPTTRLVDAQADPISVSRTLSANAELRALVCQRPGVRIPGTTAPFELAVRAILGQQISVRGACVMASRLARALGARIPSPMGALTHAFPEPEEVQGADLSMLGIPRQRAAAIAAVADRVLDGRIVLEPGASAAERLLEIRGIGPWTAAYISLRALGDGDAIPVSDLGLRQAMSHDGGPIASLAMARAARAWRPWRGYAAVHLWTSLLARRHSPVAGGN